MNDGSTLNLLAIPVGIVFLILLFVGFGRFFSL
jgi:hypothetical protein